MSGGWEKLAPGIGHDTAMSELRQWWEELGRHHQWVEYWQLRKELQKIATRDYRGNRPQEQVIAEKALERED